MEAISGIAAVVQLVQTLGTTIIQVSDAYSEVRDMEDVVRDFDGQLDATRMLLSILDNGISCGSLNSSIQDWWRQSELERLLRSCQQSFHRLNDIFIKIARQRSAVKNLRSWVRLKGYDNDINHLRLSISTCTNALQLPVIIQNIHSKGEVPDLLEELATRMAILESSMTCAQDDLVMRALQKSQESSSPAHHLKAIGDMISELKSEMSTLAASQRSEASSAPPGETKSQLAQIQATLSKLQVGTSHEEEGARQTVLEPQETKEKSDMENETRSMLELMDGLVGNVQDYVSTIDSMSVSTRRIRGQSTMRADSRGSPGLRATFQTSQDLDFPSAQLSKDQRRGIVDWVDNVDDKDDSSIISMLSGLGLRPGESEGAMVTPLTTQSSNTAAGGSKLLAELRQRRIRIVKDLMRTKDYLKALPHLDRLLMSNDDTADASTETHLCSFMARALSETTPNEVVVDSYCQRFPLIKSKLAELRLERATRAFSLEHYAFVVDMLGPYKPFFTKTDSSSTDLVGITTLQEIQLLYGQALLKSSSYMAKYEAMSILEALLEQPTLGLAGRRASHDCLAKAYYFKGNYEKAKKHGVSACQINMDLVGRDDEETQRSVALIINICLDAQDSDEAIWRQMIVDPQTTEKLQVEIVRPFEISRYPPDPAVEKRMHNVRESMVMNWSTSGASLFLRDNYSLRIVNSVSSYHDILCFNCLWENLILSQALSLSWTWTACFRHGTPRDDDGFKGPSLLHYFAMTKPQGKDNSDDSPNPD